MSMSLSSYRSGMNLSMGRSASTGNLINGVDGNSKQQTETPRPAVSLIDESNLKHEGEPGELNFAMDENVSIVQHEIAGHVGHDGSSNNENLKPHSPTMAQTDQSIGKEQKSQATAKDEVTDDPRSSNSGTGDASTTEGIQSTEDGVGQSTPADKGKKAAFVDDAPAELEDHLKETSQAVPDDDDKSEEEDLKDLEGDRLPDIIFELR